MNGRPVRAVLSVFVYSLLVLVVAHAAAAVEWTCVTQQAPWPPATASGTLATSNRLWVFHFDVWSSSDGVTWNEATSAAPCALNHVVWFKDKLWLLWEYGYIWSSPDGVNWVRESTNAPWANRDAFGLTTYADKMWIVGGTWDAYFNDVWSSSDGVNWTQVTANAPWRGRTITQIVVFNDRLYLIGGLAWDAWTTRDGLNWTEVPIPWDSPLAGPYGLQCPRAYGNRAWITSGADTLWWSTDLVNWNKATLIVPERLADRQSPVQAAFNGHLYLMGGYTQWGWPPQIDDWNDVWRVPFAEVPTLSIDTGHGSWYEMEEPLNLKVAATGIIGTAAYQWSKDGAALPGETDNIYHRDALALSDSGNYSCTVDDSGNVGPFTAGPVQITVVDGHLPAVGALGIAITVLAILAASLSFSRKSSIPFFRCSTKSARFRSSLLFHFWRTSITTSWIS